ncbi:hypothetical protein [Chitinophaga vietnamensis]|uniref:hypothetical protein n=1 Tax=Chitinophaga vietnamensis TaxID=2593957 RepID=UPI0011777C7A|nr:hypothetical protein [Chitinophaga vietnamensis]
MKLFIAFIGLMLLLIVTSVQAQQAPKNVPIKTGADKINLQKEVPVKPGGEAGSQARFNTLATHTNTQSPTASDTKNDAGNNSRRANAITPAPATQDKSASRIQSNIAKTPPAIRIESAEKAARQQ